MGNPYDLDQDGLVEEWEREAKAIIDAAEISAVSAGEGGWRSLPIVDLSEPATSVDLVNYSCDCSDWRSNRLGFPERDIRRACSHICSALLSSGIELPEFTAAIVSAHPEGVPLFSGEAQFVVNGNRILFLQIPASDAVEVVTGGTQERQSSCSTYSMHRQEWREGKKPSEEFVIRFLIHKGLDRKAQEQDTHGNG